MKRNIIVSTAVALALSLPAFAQGTDALSFSRQGRNPVTLGLGGAGTSTTFDAAYSAFSNSSVLPFMEKKFAAGVSYNLWAPSVSRTNAINVGVAYKFSPRFAMTLAYAHDSSLPYDVLDYDGVVTGSFTPSDNLVGLGLAFGLGDRLGLGVNVRYAAEKLSSDYSNRGVAGDVFLTFAVNENLRFSAGAANIGTPVTSYDKKKYAQPASVCISGAYGLGFGEAFRLDFALDANYYFSKNFSLAAGGQFGWNDMVFARIGYRFATQNAVLPSFLGIGIGGKFKGITIDLSYMTASKALGNTLAVGLGYSF
ncbi:MAG: PorV/PorQ family protein [Bacteroidales bacterium]|nr:PorV/PorQ family protein [Bacteroidales bacterium]